MKEVRVGIIGMGNMGSVHATCIIKGEVSGLRLTAVCDIDNSRTDGFVALYPTVRAYADFTTLLGDGEVDAVIIAVPHPLHAQIAEEALAAGLHVLVEKPIDIALSKARHLIEQAKATDKKLAVMLNQRTNPLFRRAREIVQSGELGELRRTVWIITNWYRTQHYYDSGGWRATWAGEGGGVLVNQAPHNLDLWQWICGMPQQITAFCQVGGRHHIEVEDEATLITRYANGATGIFVISTGEFPGTNRLEISGDCGKLVLEEGTLKWWRLKMSSDEVLKTGKESFPSIPYTYEEFTSTEKETAHRGILQNFTNAILHGEPLISPGEDALAELTLSNAAYLSQWMGNCSITLPFDTAEFDRLLSEHAANSDYVPQTTKFSPATEYKSRWQVNW